MLDTPVVIELCGWIGNILLACCGGPQAYKCWKEGHARGLSWGLVICWLLGELFGIVYVLWLCSWPIIFNYTVNIMFVCIMFYYKAWPREKDPI